MSKTYKIMVNYMSSTGCDVYRSFLPFRHCHRPLLEEGIELRISRELNEKEKCDAYVFHRHMSADFIPILNAVRMTGAKVVWDLDDNLFEIPQSNPAYGDETIALARKNSLLLYLGWSDYVTCSTIPLAEQLIRTYGVDPVRTAVLPNLIDSNDWEFAEDRCPNRKKKRVLWSGSPSHKDDLELIVDAVKNLVERRKDVHFTFVGMTPQDLLIIPPDQYAFYPGCEVKYYPAFLGNINADISLAPLVPGRFNEAKSCIKWMESTLAGAAVIASETTYGSVIEHGKTGLIAMKDGCDGKVDSWESYIEMLMDDENLRDELRENARKEVIANHSWMSEGYDKWMGFFRHLARSSQQATVA